jgi:hypothetical protein
MTLKAFARIRNQNCGYPNKENGMGASRRANIRKTARTFYGA